MTRPLAAASRHPVLGIDFGNSNPAAALVEALQLAFPQANTVHGDRSGGLAAGPALAIHNNRPVFKFAEA